MKTIFYSIAILLITLQIISIKTNDYDLLLEWGKNNSVYISNKIAMNYTNENNKKYYVKKKIKKDEIIMSISKKLLLNIDSALKIMGTKTKKLYENYKKKHLENKKNIKGDDILHYQIDQSFLAYLMTVANQYKSKNNKLYQFYKYFFNTFETNLENYPLFFNSDQLKILIFSLFGNEIIQTRQMFDEEYEMFQKSSHKKLLDQDEYIKYRIFTYKKYVNISGVSSIVPFIDMLDTNPINFNLQINYTGENDSLSIIAINDIKKNDKLVLGVVEMTNSESYIAYGKIYEETKDYREKFGIQKISQNFLRQNNLDPLMATGEIIDISKKDYYKEILPIYKEISKLLKQGSSNASALRIFLENVKLIRNDYDKVGMSELYKHFLSTDIVKNVKCILDSEKLYLDKKIIEIKKLINKFEKESDL